MKIKKILNDTDLVALYKEMKQTALELPFDLSKSPVVSEKCGCKVEIENKNTNIIFSFNILEPLCNIKFWQLSVSYEDHSVMPNDLVNKIVTLFLPPVANAAEVTEFTHLLPSDMNFIRQFMHTIRLYGV
jgi:hypothetical protein